MLKFWLSSVWQTAVLRHLRRLRQGRVTLVDGPRRYEFGEPDAELQATLHVHSPQFYHRVALGGGLGAAESLMDGEWSSDDLAALVRIFIRNDQVSTGLDRGWAALAQRLARLAHWRRRNTPANAAANIQAHYDLGNEFFQLFLDDTLSYSCGLFPDCRASLREASLAKIHRACAKLELGPDDHLLEIGTGWGALAVYAAEQFGCRVTSSTISAEQFAVAQGRVQVAGVGDRVQIVQRDYRELAGSYSKLVSIEMIEAVGREFLDTYFRQCSRLLRPDGAMLLQAIVIRDQLYGRHSASVDFIGKYIFPGGFLPSLAAISSSLSRVTDFRVCYLEELSPHYVRTLRAWRERFWDNVAEVRRLGFDERFVRMWDYYFQYCEAAFAERQVNVVQILLGKPEYRGAAGLATPAPGRARHEAPRRCAASLAREAGL